MNHFKKTTIALSLLTITTLLSQKGFAAAPSCHASDILSLAQVEKLQAMKRVRMPIQSAIRYVLGKGMATNEFSIVVLKSPDTGRAIVLVGEIGHKPERAMIVGAEAISEFNIRLYATTPPWDSRRPQNPSPLSEEPHLNEIIATCEQRVSQEMADETWVAPKLRYNVYALLGRDHSGSLAPVMYNNGLDFGFEKKGQDVAETVCPLPYAEELSYYKDILPQALENGVPINLAAEIGRGYNTKLLRYPYVNRNERSANNIKTYDLTLVWDSEDSAHQWNSEPFIGVFDELNIRGLRRALVDSGYVECAL